MCLFCCPPKKTTTKLIGRLIVEWHKQNSAHLYKCSLWHHRHKIVSHNTSAQWNNSNGTCYCLVYYKRQNNVAFFSHSFSININCKCIWYFTCVKYHIHLQLFTFTFFKNLNLSLIYIILHEQWNKGSYRAAVVCGFAFIFHSCKCFARYSVFLFL